MGKYTYYLTDDSDGRIVSKLEVTIDPDLFCLMGVCYNATSWAMEKDGSVGVVLEWKFLAEVYCKWDSCTHWYFFGERYDSDNKSHDCDDIDGYYHLCGLHSFVTHIRHMCFIWRAAEMWMARYKSETYVDMMKEYYHDNEEQYELVEKILEGYSIELVET